MFKIKTFYKYLFIILVLNSIGPVTKLKAVSQNTNTIGLMFEYNYLQSVSNEIYNKITFLNEFEAAYNVFFEESSTDELALLELIDSVMFPSPNIVNFNIKYKNQDDISSFQHNFTPPNLSTLGSTTVTITIDIPTHLQPTEKDIENYMLDAIFTCSINLTNNLKNKFNRILQDIVDFETKYRNLFPS